MHHIMAVGLLMFGLAADAANMSPPIQPPEGIRVAVRLSIPSKEVLKDWWEKQTTRIGPPATHQWLVWRLELIPEGMGGPLVSGCEKLLRDGEMDAIDIPKIGPGLWRMTATVQTDPADNRQIVLAAWRCIEVQSGKSQTDAELWLQPSVPLVVRLALDQPPNPKDPAMVGICIFDDHGLIDLKLVEMQAQTTNITYPIAPQGRLRVLAVVLNDQVPTRRGQRTAILEQEHSLIILPLARPSSDLLPSLPPSTAPAVPASAGTAVLFSGKHAFRTELIDNSLQPFWCDLGRWKSTKCVLN